MSLNADIMLERIHLKNQARRWRMVAFAIALATAFIIFYKFYDRFESGNFAGHAIARFALDEVIFDDVKRSKLMKEIAEDDSYKALILRIDTPGGTTVGSEQLFLELRKIAEKKPVVATMRSIATSGGYMAAVGADYIVAREGTLTGSVGVIMQTAEITELAEKIGIKPIVVRSGALKATPTPIEKFDENTRTMLEGIIQDFYQYFINLVKERRGLSDEQVAYISDGRVVSARQALNNNLIDEIGGEDEALAWLKETHQINTDLEIVDVEIPKEENPIQQLFESAFKGTILENLTIPLDGLVSIWHPAGLK